MKWCVAFMLAMLAQIAAGETVVAALVIRPQSIISAEDLAIKHVKVPGAFSDPADLIGQEARIALYPGRPIRFSDVGPPALVSRNQIVTLNFLSGALSISVEGRSLSRAGAGELVRVMNLSSRTTVTGLVMADGSIEIRK